MTQPKQPEKALPIDHVSRLIKSNFQVVNHELLISHNPVSRLIESFGSPLFVYDANVIQDTLGRVKNILPENFELYYSIKANPNASLLKLMLRNGLGLEVASGGELYQALNAGCPANHVIFAGPGKTRDELRAAVVAGISEIHVESVEEAILLSEIGVDASTDINICLRINPTDAAGGAMRMGGRPSPFGIDEETLDKTLNRIKKLPSLHVVGIHLFMGTQILDASILLNQYQRALSLARQVASQLDSPLRSVDFGGGWGTPYFPHEHCLDLEQLKSVLHQISTEMRRDTLLAQAKAIVEPGRFLVNESGVYLSKVTRVKRSRGKTFVVIDGGMHHHLAGSGNLGQTIKRNFPVAIANQIGCGDVIPTEVVGPLCTPLDTLARNAMLPSTTAGDIFCVFQSGAYARTSSPHDFLSHPPPAEVIIADGIPQVVRRRGRASDLLVDQIDSG
jgi:diaminopimelate decarboxylase